MNKDKTFKIVLLGIGAVGKTALCIRYTNDKFIQNYDPTIEDCYRRIAEVDRELYHVEIVDTAGTDQFSTMREIYLKSADGFLLVCSLINKNSLIELGEIHKQIIRVKNDPNFPVTIAANKCDLPVNEWEFNENEVQSFCNPSDIPYFMTSAKSGIVKEPFECIIRQILKLKPQQQTTTSTRRFCNLL